MLDHLDQDKPWVPVLVPTGVVAAMGPQEGARTATKSSHAEKKEFKRKLGKIF